MANLGQKRSFKTVSHKHLFTTNVNKIMLFGSKMSQTKHKTLKARYFLRFSLRNWGLNLEHVFFKINTEYRILLCKSYAIIPKFLKVIRTILIVSKSLFTVVSDEVLNLTLRLQDIKKTKD